MTTTLALAESVLAGVRSGRASTNSLQVQRNINTTGQHQAWTTYIMIHKIYLQFVRLVRLIVVAYSDNEK